MEPRSQEATGQAEKPRSCDTTKRAENLRSLETQVRNQLRACIAQAKMHQISGIHPRARSRKLSLKKWPRASSHCGRARVAQGFRARMNNFHSILIEVLNTAQMAISMKCWGWCDNNGISETTFNWQTDWGYPLVNELSSSNPYLSMLIYQRVCQSKVVSGMGVSWNGVPLVITHL